MWEIERSKEILNWFTELEDDSKKAIFIRLSVLSEFGPMLGRPYVDTIKGSKLNNLKELRISCKEHRFRIFFIFNLERKAVLLIGGDKKTSSTFYKEMVSRAEKIYKVYTAGLEDKNE